MTFGKPFGAIEAAKSHFWIKTIHDTGHIWGLTAICRRSVFLQLLSVVPQTDWISSYPIFWPLLLLVAPKDLKSAFKKHEELTRDKVRERIARRHEISHVDFFTNLLSEKSRDQSEKFMLAQATLLVIGGSDTTALFLTAVSYFLLQRPSTLKKLQDEIRGTFSNVEDITNETIQDLKYLNAVIEEGMSSALFPSGVKANL